MKVFTIIKRESERVPYKNFREFRGLPLWFYSLRKFEEHELYINTDCPELFEETYKRQFQNLTLIPRDEEDVTMEASSKILGSPVERMFGKFINDHVSDLDEPLALTHVTSPFLTNDSLQKASSHLHQGWKSVHSVQVIQDFGFKIDELSGSWSPLNFDPSRVQRTQDLQPILFSLGAFFVLTKRAWQIEPRRVIDPCYFYPLSRLESIEIDTYEDLRFAEGVSHGEAD